MIFFYILVLTASMPNHPVFEAPFAGLTVVKWLGITCCAYAFSRLLRCERQPAFLKSWEAKFFLVLVGIATLSFFTLSKTEGLTFSPMFTYVSYLLLFFTTISVVNTYERLHRTLLVAIAGAALASLYVIREFQVSGGTNLRPGYVAGDSNYFATCAVLVIPIAVYFAKMKTSRLQRWFCGLSLVLILLGFTLASSRGGLIGLCVAILYMIVFSGRSRRGAILTAVLLLPMMLLSPASPLSRMLHPGYGDFLGEQVRRDFWMAGLDMVRNHAVTGIGLGNFTAQSFTISREVEGKHGVACNTFLEVAAEMGIPGFLAYFAILVGALSSAGKLRAEGKRLNEDLLRYAGEGMQAGLLGFSAAAMFVSAEYQKPFWIIVALTATVPTLLRRQSAGQTSLEPELVTSGTSVPAANF
jgi:putative inorganic carbon (hco3(-)) transporter